MRHLLLFGAIFSALIPQGALAQSEEDTHAAGRYAWLPRGLYLGTYLNKDVWTPQARLQWEIPVIEERRDSLVFLFEGGGGYGVSFTSTAGTTEDVRMTYIYQHMVGVGLGYRGRKGVLRWGAELVTGPFFYGARFDRLPTENRFSGIVDGRLRAGLDLGTLTVGLAIGYASPYSEPFRSNAVPYVGGFSASLFLDRWH